MFKIVLLTMIVVPVIEIYLLIKVASLIGGVATVALLLGISLVGGYLVRSQGFRIVNRVRHELAHGHLPAASLLDGALELVGGMLLLIPGFFTDFLGILFLIPFTRKAIKLWLGHWLAARLARGQFLVRRR